MICGHEARVRVVDDFLWSAAVDDWLPHGTAKLGQAESQPIWVGPPDDLAAPPNQAKFLFLLDGVADARLARFSRVFDLFDGNDERAVTNARLRWTQAKADGYAMLYWRQTDKGWERGK